MVCLCTILGEWAPFLAVRTCASVALGVRQSCTATQRSIPILYLLTPSIYGHNARSVHWAHPDLHIPAIWVKLIFNKFWMWEFRTAFFVLCIKLDKIFLFRLFVAVPMWSLFNLPRFHCYRIILKTEIVRIWNTIEIGILLNEIRQFIKQFRAFGSVLSFAIHSIQAMPISFT